MHAAQGDKLYIFCMSGTELFVLHTRSNNGHCGLKKKRIFAEAHVSPERML